ncbi:MAG: RadC family protein [Cyclobacteriaceae bacterium]
MVSSSADLLKFSEWHPDDRPREKMISKGAAALTDTELIAILLGSGSSRHPAPDLARVIMARAYNNLYHLGKLTVNDLMQLHGIGAAKAVTIVAAMELGRRRRETNPLEKPEITSSKDAFNLLHGDISDLPYEEFWVLLLNRANKMIVKKRISTGGVSGTIADPKLIYSAALESLASGIIVAHNHPSGSLIASKQDIDLTKKLIQGGKMLDINLLDHLIIAGNKYFSFADEGYISVS